MYVVICTDEPLRRPSQFIPFSPQHMLRITKSFRGRGGITLGIENKNRLTHNSTKESPLKCLAYQLRVEKLAQRTGKAKRKWLLYSCKSHCLYFKRWPIIAAQSFFPLLLSWVRDEYLPLRSRIYRTPIGQCWRASHSNSEEALESHTLFCRQHSLLIRIKKILSVELPAQSFHR